MKKLLIAHRGNILGPNPDRENSPDYIKEALDQGYHVEIDVWKIDDKFVLGHDKPQYEVKAKYLNNKYFWLHAKNIEAVSYLNAQSVISNFINCFYHDTDDCVLTSQKWLWVYPGRLIVGPRAIAVMPERVDGWDISKATGVCSDYPNNY